MISKHQVYEMRLICFADYTKSGFLKGHWLSAIQKFIFNNCIFLKNDAREASKVKIINHDILGEKPKSEHPDFIAEFTLRELSTNQ